MFLEWKNRYLTWTKNTSNNNKRFKIIVKKRKSFYRISVYFVAQPEVIFPRFSKLLQGGVRENATRHCKGTGILCFSEIQCRFHTHLLRARRCVCCKIDRSGGKELFLALKGYCERNKILFGFEKKMVWIASEELLSVISCYD